MTLFILLIFLISLWSLTFYAGRIVRNDMQTTLARQQLSTATFVAAAVDQELDERLKALDAVAGLVRPALLGNTVALQSFLEQRADLQLQFNGGSVFAFKVQAQARVTGAAARSANPDAIAHGEQLAATFDAALAEIRAYLA